MSKNAKTRVLMIGIDSGDKDLIDEWSAAGDLPNIASLANRSLTGEVHNAKHLETGSVWPTFHAGVRVGSHPHYDGMRKFNSETCDHDWFQPGDNVTDPFFKNFSKAGYRCAIIDAPFVFLDPSINGLQVVDYATHVPSLGGGKMQFAAHPKSAEQEILDLVGPDPTGGILCDDRCPETLQDHINFRDMYLDRIKRKAKFTKHFLDKGGWDYFEVVFTDAHCMGHHLWHVNDKNHPRYNAEWEKEIGEPLRDGYRCLDEAAGQLLSSVDERTLVLFYCSHGIGPQFSATGLLDQMLLCIEEGRTFSPQGGLIDRARSVWRKLPPGLRSAMRPFKNSAMSLAEEQDFAGNRKNRKFFEIWVSNGTGGVRLNVKGRENPGLIDPADYDEVVDDLIAKLQDVKIVETGELHAAEIHKGQELHPGSRSDELPDILVVWNKNAHIETVSSTLVGVLPNHFSNDRRSGDHKPTGLFYCAGPGITPGRLNAQVDVTDFAKTFQRFFDVPEDYLEGAPIPTLDTTTA